MIHHKKIITWISKFKIGTKFNKHKLKRAFNVVHKPEFDKEDKSWYVTVDNFYYRDITIYRYKSKYYSEINWNNIEILDNDNT